MKVKFEMVKENKKEIQNLQKQLKLTIFKHLPNNDNDYKQAMKSKNQWLIKFVKRQGEGREGKGHMLPSGVTILLTRLILYENRDDPSSPMSVFSN